MPVAVIGTEAIRRGWRIRPHKVRIRAGRALRFPPVEDPSPALAGAVTDRIWPCVMLQWEWLGGLAPVRRIAVIGAGASGTAPRRLPVARGARGRARLPHPGAGRGACRRAASTSAICRACAARSGCASRAPPSSASKATTSSAWRCRPRRCPRCSPPTAARSRAGRACSSCPRASSRRSARCPRRSRRSAPARTRSRCSAARRTRLRCSSAAHRSSSPRSTGASPASCRTCSRSASSTSRATTDVTGVELAGCAKNAAALAAAAASIAGPNVAGAAAGKVFAEVDALARARAARPETFAGLAGAGRARRDRRRRRARRNRRAGELLDQACRCWIRDGSAGRRGRRHVPRCDAAVGLVEGRRSTAAALADGDQPDPWAGVTAGRGASATERGM